MTRETERRRSVEVWVQHRGVWLTSTSKRVGFPTSVNRRYSCRPRSLLSEFRTAKRDGWSRQSSGWRLAQTDRQCQTCGRRLNDFDTAIKLPRRCVQLTPSYCIWLRNVQRRLSFCVFMCILSKWLTFMLLNLPPIITYFPGFITADYAVKLFSYFHLLIGTLQTHFGDNYSD